MNNESKLLSTLFVTPLGFMSYSMWDSNENMYSILFYFSWLKFVKQNEFIKLEHMAKYWRRVVL